MGLDTTHNCWHAPYSTFHRWRMMIAKQVGINDLEAWWNTNGYPPETFSGEWIKFPDDPIVILLQHSDCDGIIPTIYCRPLADRLERIFHTELNGRNEQLTRQFIAGLRLAAERGEDVEFH